MTYSANAKFTVVIAFDEKLQDAWTSASSAAVRKLEKALANEMGFERQATLLVRRLTQKGADLKLATDSYD